MATKPKGPVDDIIKQITKVLGKAAAKEYKKRLNQVAHRRVLKDNTTIERTNIPKGRERSVHNSNMEYLANTATRALAKNPKAVVRKPSRKGWGAYWESEVEMIKRRPIETQTRRVPKVVKKK